MSIKKDTAWNIFGSGAPLLIAIVTIPWLLKNLGAEGFGLLSLMWALVGYFSLFDLGIGRALTYELSKIKGNDQLVGGVLKSGLLVTAVMGVVGSVLVFFILAPMAHQWFHVDAIAQSTVKTSFQFVALAIIPSTITSAVRGALEGLNGFKKSNYIKVMLGVVTFSAPPLAIIYGQDGLISAAIGLLLGRVLICAYAIFEIRKYLIEKSGDVISIAKRLLGYGLWVTLSGLISPIMVYGDRFFVTSAIGAALLPLYAVPQEAMQRLLIFPAALAGALLPRLVVIDDVTELFSVYRKQMRNVAIGMAFICLCSIFFGPLVLRYWISPEFSEKTRLVVLCLSIGIWFNSIAQIPYALLNAKGFPRVVAKIHLCELFIYIFAVYFLASKFGVIGAAVAWGLRAALDAVLLHFWALKCMNRKK